MNVILEPEADAEANRLFEDESPAYDKLWDVLERIAEDPEEAKHARWTNYVSSHGLWGAKIPGTDYTLFWKTADDHVVGVLLVEDRGL